MAKLHKSVKDWDLERLGDLSGKRYLVTGANSGLGLKASEYLYAGGAHVYLTARSEQKCQSAIENIAGGASPRLSCVVMDLSSMDSVRAAAKDLQTMTDSLDGIVNNAGIMQPPETRTSDGNELQFATNHLGHFLLNGLLFDLVDRVDGRFVPVSSVAHRQGKIDLDDLNSEEDYSPTAAYCQSKLANLMYGLELQRRLEKAGSSATAISCHPGFTATNLQSSGPTGFFKAMYKVSNRLLAQSVERGALPLVLAVAGSEAEPGGYYGPTGMGGIRGKVGDCDVASRALDTDVAAKLWSRSESLVAFEWPIGEK